MFRLVGLQPEYQQGGVVDSIHEVNQNAGKGEYLMNPWGKITLRISLMLSVLALAPVTADAAITIYINQSGTSVIASYSGSLNTTNLTAIGGLITTCGVPNGELTPSSSVLCVGPNGSVQGYSGVTSWPPNFGTGGPTTANSGSGSSVVINNNTLYLPVGYVSGATISGSSTWTNQTIAGLGMTPGTYQWPWNGDSITVSIGPPVTAVPTLPERALILLGAIVATLGMWKIRPRANRI